MKIAISAESTVDLSTEQLNQFGIKTLPLYVYLGGEEFKDGELPCSKIFEYVKSSKKLPKTSAPNDADYEEFFNNLRKDYDAVIHFSISSELSSSYGHAKNVAEKLDNVFVVDTKALSSGIALLCLYAKKLVEKDYSVEEILTIINSKIPFVQTSFIINELNYLYKGGRCNSLVLLGANLLKIHPQIQMINGELKSHKKFFGNLEQTLIKYTNGLLEEFNNPDYENVFITTTTVPDSVRDKLAEILKAKGFKNIYYCTAGATITSYCGENCLGVLYINEKSDI